MKKNNAIEKRKETLEKGIKQVMTLEETETHIVIDYYNRKLKIYTSKATIMNRLQKGGVEHIKEDKIGGEVLARFYEFPTSELGKFLRTSYFKYD